MPTRARGTPQDAKIGDPETETTIAQQEVAFRIQSSVPALTDTSNQRGLLEDTLIFWCGEFGRTVYCQGKL